MSDKTVITLPLPRESTVRQAIRATADAKQPSYSSPGYVTRLAAEGTVYQWEKHQEQLLNTLYAMLRRVQRGK